MQHKNAVLKGLQDMRAYDNIGSGIVYSVNGTSYTTDQMIEEIKNDTEVGKKFSQDIYNTIISYLGKFTQCTKWGYTLTKESFEKLVQADAEKAVIITAVELEPYIANRTLLYGYTCERKTFHVYLKNNKIYTVVYENDYSTGKAKPKNMRQIVVSSNHDFVPDKRVYPERSDYIFCKLLKEKGIELSFASYPDSLLGGNYNYKYYKYYGFTIEDTEQLEVLIWTV